MNRNTASRRPLYHLRVFALGVPFVLAAVAILYGMTFLPLWIAEIPCVVATCYAAGKLVEIWAHR